MSNEAFYEQINFYDSLTCADTNRIIKAGNLLFSALDNDLLGTPEGCCTGHLIVKEILPSGECEQLWEKVLKDGVGRKSIQEKTYEYSLSRKGFKLIREVQEDKNSEEEYDKAKRTKWSATRSTVFKDYKTGKMRMLEVSFSGRPNFISELFISLAVRVLYAHFSEHIYRPKDEVVFFSGDETVAMAERVIDKFITIRFSKSTPHSFSPAPAQMVG